MQNGTDNIFLLIVLSIAGSLLLSAGAVYLFIAYQRRVARQKEEMQQAAIAHQKELLESVITSQEAERKRIGMDLHDEVGAALSTLRIKIERYAGQDNTEGEFSLTCKEDIDRIVTNMRNISHSLSPRISGNFGFHDAIHELSDHVNRSGKINMTVDFDENSLPVFINEQAPMALYRVFTELVNNTLKHAMAKNIMLTVAVTDDKMNIVYTDDGMGIQPNTGSKSNGMGLQNIESRLGIIGAKWEVESPAIGYRMVISVPVKTKDNGEDQHSAGR